MLLAQIPEDVQYRGDGKRERLLLARGVPDPCCPLSRCLGLAVCPRGQHPLPGAAVPGIQEFLGSLVRMEEHPVLPHPQDRARFSEGNLATLLMASSARQRWIASA
jgi:hypothetical protein